MRGLPALAGRATIVNVQKPSLGPWLFGLRTDLALFLGSSLVALAIGALGNALGLQALPDGAWLVLVLGIDVAHVHATWFRTYLDASELKRRPARYLLAPLLAYAACFLLYRYGALNFWRGLAYLAVFHFVRQQVGWVALYRSREGSKRALDRVIDEAAVYAATSYPLLVWHAHALDKGFSWFVSGDFVALLSISRTVSRLRPGLSLVLSSTAIRRATSGAAAESPPVPPSSSRCS